MRRRITELEASETQRKRAEEVLRVRVAKLEIIEAERKCIEEELRQSEDRYRYLIDSTSGEGERDTETNLGLGILDALPFYVLLVDETHHILLANKAVRRDLGLDPEQIVGRYCPKIVHGLDGPFPGCPLEEAVDKGHAVERELFDPYSGRWMKSAIYPTKHRTQDGRAIFIHMIHDITERKRVEEEIERNYQIQTVLNALLSISLIDVSLEDQLKLILDHILSIPWLAFESRGSIFLVEDDPDVLVMKAQNGLGDPVQKACARVAFGRCHCGRAALTQEIQFADRLDDRHETRYEGITPHGHYCVPILYAGRTLGVINLYLREGHRRDQREEEFLTAVANTLAGIIMRRHVEEEKEKIQAQLLQAQKMEALGTLAGGVAHDFNNLLTVIQGHTELAMITLNEGDPVYRDLKQIQRASMRAANLTRQLLLFSRKQPMELAPLNINRTVDDLLKMLNRLIGEDIVINTDLEPDLWTVRADAGNIEQVIMNLAVNARDAMPEGGTLTIKTENVTLDEDCCKVIPEARPGKYVCLSVADTGVGMDKEIIQHIFEPFFSTKEAVPDLVCPLSMALSNSTEGG